MTTIKLKERKSQQLSKDRTCRPGEKEWLSVSKKMNGCLRPFYFWYVFVVFFQTTKLSTTGHKFYRLQFKEFNTVSNFVLVTLQAAYEQLKGKLDCTSRC